eukprot:504821_1
MSTVLHRLSFLVSGYVRNRFKSKQIVPAAIIEMLRNFYNGVTQWKIYRNTCYRYKEIYGPFVTIRDIAFQLGYMSSSDSLILKLDSYELLPNVVNLSLLITMYENGNTKQLSFNGGWTKHCYDIIGATKYENRSSECHIWKCFNSISKSSSKAQFIDVSVSIDILDIKYYQMNVINHINWKHVVHKTSFKNEKFDCFWYKGESTVLMAIKPIAIPYKINHIEMKFEFKCEENNNILFDCVRKCCRHSNGNSNVIRFECACSKFVQATELIITVVKVVDYSLNTIAAKEWHKYGFMR